MFILGCFLGVLLFYFVSWLYDKTESAGWSIFAVVMAIALVFDLSDNAGVRVGMIVGFVVFFVIYLSIAVKRASNNVLPPQDNQQDLYINHCWNCYSDIDSRRDRLCPKCEKHYICPVCGKCYCDRN